MPAPTAVPCPPPPPPCCAPSQTTVRTTAKTTMATQSKLSQTINVIMGSETVLLLMTISAFRKKRIVKMILQTITGVSLMTVINGFKMGCMILNIITVQRINCAIGNKTATIMAVM